MTPYALTVFLSAFLLFQVQLILGKYLLPWFGGAAAVWTTCMLFFQVLLLAGYAYAHWLNARLTLRAQRRLHSALLLVSLAWLAGQELAWGRALLAGAEWKPLGSDAPIAQLLAVLAVAVGPPFLVLATTGSLLQAWFSRAHPQQSPYRLYALSNLGSLLGLLSYPFVIEVLVPLRGQALGWLLGYGAFALGILWCAHQARAAESGAAAPIPQPAHGRPPTRAQFALWFAFAACAATLLLAITNQMTQEVTAVPFLWMLPLVLYLLSLILCFGNRRWYRRGLYLAALLPALAFATLLLKHGARVPWLAQIGVWSFVLFVCCMVCHGEIVRRRPAARYLTRFYLAITLGGAAGGLFVGLVAPLAFRGLWELPIALVLCAALVMTLLVRERRSFLYHGSPTAAVAALFAALWVAGFVFGERLVSAAPETPATPEPSPGHLLLTIGATYLAQRRWCTAPAGARSHAAVRRGMLAGAVLVFALTHAWLAAEPGVERVASARNFYGMLQVLEEDAGHPTLHTRILRHGHILHGFQFQAAEYRQLPNAYYGPGSGIALAIEQHPARSRGLRLGVVGLGTGTLAAYGRAHDSLRFYELNPEVVRLAAGPQALFTFTRDSASRIEVVPGDARLALERELAQGAAQDFDILAIDAFTSDAIPAHLLTREAIALYRAHLAPAHGVLAVHISNRNLDLRPVLAGAAAHLDLGMAVIEADESTTGYASTWVLLTADRAWLEQPAIAAATQPPPRRRVLWTDDYSNLLGALKL